jgi:N-acetylglutamate synthase-like GNAT family acetyltransferase
MRAASDAEAKSGGTLMIRRCIAADIPAIESIINEAAEKYRGVIPADCWHEPYMSRAELEREIAAGVSFSGWDAAGELIGVMGAQRVKDATLIRHAYVRTAQQGRGIGGKLLTAFSTEVDGKLLIGTWADASWAIRFYQGRGFRLVPQDEKNQLLDTYWTISERQRNTSVVLMR